MNKRNFMVEAVMVAATTPAVAAGMVVIALLKNIW
jgi:hypothetical protein